MGDDPKSVGDGLRYPLPFQLEGFAKKPEDRLGEPPEARMEPVVRYVAVHAPIAARWD